MICSAPSCLAARTPRSPTAPSPDDGDRLAWPRLGSDGAEPAGAQDVGGGQQARHEVVGRSFRGGDEGAVGVLDADQFGLAAVVAGPVQAVGVRAGLAQGAGVVAGQEPADDEVAGFDGGDVGTDGLDDTDVFVPDGRRLRHFCDAAVAPQVRPAHAGRYGADHGVRGLEDGRIGQLLKPDVVGGVNDGASHETSPVSG